MEEEVALILWISTPEVDSLGLTDNRPEYSVGRLTEAESQGP